MGEAQFVMPLNGTEVQKADLQLLGQTAGLADDRVFAEFLRLNPFDGSTFAKAIAPYGLRELSESKLGAVIPGSGGLAEIGVLPFRVFVGSRVTTTTDPIANWRDIRSGIFVGQNSHAPSYINNIQIAANPTANPRWDLVCAQLTVDNPTSTVTRRVKDPNSSTVSIQSVKETLLQSVSVVVVPGVSAPSPSPPSLPPDQPSANPAVFYVPLASVRVPNGFNATSTVAAQDIRDASTPVLMASAVGAMSACPATGNNDRAGTYATNFPWGTGAGTRPPMWLPPGMTGGEWRIVEIDVLTGTPSHPDTSVVDDSTDWRSRFFVVHVQASNRKFGNDPTSSPGGTTLPDTSTTSFTQLGNSCQVDGALSSGNASVFNLNSSTAPGVVSTGTVGVYVDHVDGKMKCSLTGSPAVRVWAAILAFGVYPNR